MFYYKNYCARTSELNISATICFDRLPDPVREEGNMSVHSRLVNSCTTIAPTSDAHHCPPATVIHLFH